MALSDWGKKIHPRHQALRQRIAHDPYYRFSSLEEIAIATELGIRIEVSHAAVDDWLRLPGISIHQARQLVELSQMGLQLLSIDDLAAALSLPVHRLKPFAPILAFSYCEPDSLLATQRINPNTASPHVLTQIPYLTAAMIEQLITERQTNGYYKNLADFQQRLRLNSELLSQLMHYLQFS